VRSTIVPVVSARLINAEISMAGCRLETSGRMTFDWDLVLQQIEGAYSRRPDNQSKQAVHQLMLSQLDWERGAYKTEFIDAARTAHDGIEVIWDDAPEKDLILANHWAEWQAAVRAKMRCLDEVEEKLDAAFILAIEQAKGIG
jgi:hypothetical protein